MNKKNKIVTVPDHITLLSESIKCTNPDAARLLVQRAMHAIYPHKSWKQDTWTDAELDAVVALMQGMNPKDTVEALLVAQFVALHLQGMANMAQENYNIMGHALMMIRLSHQTLSMLQQYRGKSQTINVNYNVLNEGNNAILNTVINAGDTEKKGE